jgi:molecular chaperone GrpE
MSWVAGFIGRRGSVTDKDTQFAEAQDASQNDAASAVNEERPDPNAPKMFTQEQYEGAQAQAKEYLDSLQRTRAEFANYKKRTEREMQDRYQFGSVDALKSLLPVIDDFERAFSNMPSDLKDNSWVSGVLMIQRKFDRLLEQYGITQLDPTGQAFNPAQMEAVGEDEAGETPSGHVSATLQKGYIVGERVLRPALVRVAR